MITITFDMDGTIANLYGVENWLPKLQAEDPTPYAIAEPLVDMARLNELLTALKETGDFRIAVVTWGSINCSTEYTRAVKKVKREWLNKYNFPYDELHCVKHGTPKHKFMKSDEQLNILWDDDAEIRKLWTDFGGIAFNPCGNAIIEMLELTVDMRMRYGGK